MFITPIHLLVAVGIASSSSRETVLEWPREIVADEASILIYQPQLETFQGDKLTGRAAISVTPKNATQPIFGAVWLSARVSTDRDARLVKLIELDVPHAKFPNVDTDKITKLTEILKREIPRWDLALSLDRLLTALELAEKEQRSDEQLNTAPPVIHYRPHSAVLIVIDGDPILQKAGDGSLMKVANSPYFMVLEVATGTYYLKGGNDWLEAKEVLGPWGNAAKVPEAVLRLAAEEIQGVIVSGTGSKVTLPQIIVSTVPAELIVTEGEPEYTPIQGTELLAVANTESELFLDISSQQLFVLLSGRWFSTSSLEKGPWAFVSADQLPATFARIPPDSDQGGVLANVPGTDQALDAVLETYVPQTSEVRRDDRSLVVEYDGKPEFAPIEGTDLEYAVNTSYSVIRVGPKYYCCHEAVWYVADASLGPWYVCASVPDAIYTIPPSYPVYHVKYVYVYSYTPDVVYVGYTPGYVGCYVHHGVVVYGTGYHYVGWHRSVYYARPATWGFAVRYNPYTGSWGFRAGYHRGGTWVVGGGVGRGWWGAGGYRNIDVDVNRNINIDRSININRDNVYNRKDNRNRNVAREGAIGDRRPGSDPVRAPESRLRESGPASGTKEPNNVFADRDGNVYRKTEEGWQSSEKDGWVDRDPPKSQERESTSTKGSRVSESRDTRSSGLEQESRARDRGTTRTRDFQRSGGSRRGGRRR